MSQSKILVDTNSYLRLAKTIRPLLSTPFGDEEYCLYVLPDLNEELKNYKLQNKFHWIKEKEYVQNRQQFPDISRKQKKSIENTLDYLWNYVQTELPGPSKVDTLYIAYSIELDIPVVTDDQDMTALSKAFEAKVISTLELLKIMLVCGHTDMKTIEGLRDYWKYIGDCPSNLGKDFKRLFSEKRKRLK